VSDDPAPVSVIVYCDGRDALLEETLRSLARQTLAELAVVLVGKPPSEKQLARISPGLTAADVRSVSLHPIPGAVSTVARNDAIGASPSRFALELFAGDRIEPTALEKAAWTLETKPRAGLVAFREPEASPRRPEFGPVGPAELASGRIGPGEYMFRVAAWREVRGFDSRAPDNAADRDLLIRMARRGWEALTIPEVLTHPRAGAARAGPTSGPDGDAAAERWLRSRHRRFYARATLGRLVEDATERLRRRAPRLFAVRRWIARKTEVEGLTDRRRALRHPLDSALRLMPRPLKGRLWRRLGLPVRPELWTYEPPQLDLPSASRLRPMAALAPKPRKTQLLVAHHYLTLGGAGAVVLNLLTGIDRNRFDVHLITTDRGPDGDPGRLPLRKFAEQTDSIYQLPSFLEKDYYLRFLIDFIASRRVDVVLVSLSVFTYQALPRLRTACPDTAFLDLLHAEAPYAPMDQIRLASRYRQFLDRRVVTTELVRSAQIAKHGETADRVVVIPNGIDTAGTFNPRGARRGAFRRELGIGGEVAIVLYYGRMAVEKQPMHVVDVAERLRERSDIAFVLLGDGPQTSVVERAISARGLTNVYLAQTREDIRTVIADADLMMFPSKREGLPMAGLESMSMGKPIVASRVPGWVDLVSDGTEGFLVDDGDIAGYADAIARLLADRALYDLMSRAGRDKATRGYDVRDTVSAWERLLSAPRDAFGPARA
jgi:glycosyltransferase involved in cell wall biosynthesis